MKSARRLGERVEEMESWDQFQDSRKLKEVAGCISRCRRKKAILDYKVTPQETWENHTLRWAWFMGMLNLISNEYAGYCFKSWISYFSPLTKSWIHTESISTSLRISTFNFPHHSSPPYLILWIHLLGIFHINFIQAPLQMFVINQPRLNILMAKT